MPAGQLRGAQQAAAAVGRVRVKVLGAGDAAPVVRMVGAHDLHLVANAAAAVQRVDDLRDGSMLKQCCDGISTNSRDCTPLTGHVIPGVG